MQQQRSLGSIIRQNLSFQCPICMEEYNEADRFPIIICHNQHCCCLRCSEQYIFKGVSSGHCPICNLPISKSNSIRFRFLSDIRKTAEQLKAQSSCIRKSAQNLQQCRKQLSEERDKSDWLLKQYELKQSQNQQLRKHILQLQTKLKSQATVIKQYENRVQNHAIVPVQNSNSDSRVSPAIVAEKWVSHYCFHYRNLLLRQNSIAQHNQKSGADIFGSWIMDSSRSHFSVLIDRLDSNGIGLGVVDDDYKTREYLYEADCPHLIRFFADGKVFNKKQWLKSNTGFREGELVTIQVDFQRGIISWIVNDQIRREVQNELLLSAKIKWAPFIWLWKQSKCSIVP